MAYVMGLVITSNSSTSQADIDAALLTAAIDPANFLDAVVLVEEDANRPAKICVFYSGSPGEQ